MQQCVAACVTALEQNGSCFIFIRKFESYSGGRHQLRLGLGRVIGASEAFHALNPDLAAIKIEKACQECI
ncbi:hypothetical protein TIFTF001_043571 [Ficus carica]|uniref:Uncharacterized protein n=1 Tax=Ficus carica TaxID=3494 RepID=A0AA88CLW4_FICCA|nr:hypothetical protein TIFTF001_043571 [Ficus carica]